MAPDQPSKHYYAQETTDAYAEGWDAHAAKPHAKTPPPNPYRVELQQIATTHAKRSARQVDHMAGDADLWDAGWRDWEIEGGRQ